MKIFAVLLMLPQWLLAAPLTSSFTYQGELQQSGQLAQGFFDLRFRLFDNAVDGLQLGATVEVDDVLVTTGVFSVELNFGSAPFAGDQLFIDIGVRSGDQTGGFQGLVPRQALNATPYALHAEMVAMGAVSGVEIANNSVTAADIGSNAVTASELANGAVDSAAVQAGAIGQAQLAVNAVGSAQVADNSLTGDDFAPGSIGVAEINTNEVQQRITGVCPIGTAFSQIAANGVVVCSRPMRAARQVIDGESFGLSMGLAAVITSSQLPLLTYKREASGLGETLHAYACADLDCRSGVLTELDASSRDNGGGPDVALNAAGLPVISYVDTFGEVLKLYSCANSQCTSGMAVSITAVGPGNGTAANRTSVVLGQDNLPLIAVSRDLTGTSRELLLIQCAVADCSSSTEVVLDSEGQVGSFASMAVRQNGLPVVVYLDEGEAGDKDVGFYDCTSADCETGLARRVTTPDDFDGLSFALGSGDNARISLFRDSFLNIIRCNNPSCTSSSRFVTAGAFASTTQTATLWIPSLQDDDVVSFSSREGTILFRSLPFRSTLLQDSSLISDLTAILRPDGTPLLAYRASGGYILTYGCGDARCLN